VRQQNSGAVKDFILPYSAVYLRIQKWKNYWNRSTFAKVIVKIKVARFYGPRCIYVSWVLWALRKSDQTDRLSMQWMSICAWKKRSVKRYTSPRTSAVCRSNHYLTPTNHPSPQ